MESIKSLVIYMYSFCNNTTTHPSCGRADSGIEASYIPSDSQDPDSFIKYYVSFLHVIIFFKKNKLIPKLYLMSLN